MGSADTLITSSAPLAGRVWGGTLFASTPIDINALHEGSLSTVSVGNRHSGCFAIKFLDDRAWYLHGILNVQMTVRLIQLKYVRNQCRKHDYFVSLANLQDSIFVIHNRRSQFYSKEEELRICCHGGEHEMIRDRGGKGNLRVWTETDLQKYPVVGELTPTSNYRYQGYILQRDFVLSQGKIAATMPLSELLPRLSKPTMLDIAFKHNAVLGRVKQSKASLLESLQDHTCISCPAYVAVFEEIKSAKSGKDRMAALRQRRLQNLTPKPINFPPAPLTKELESDIISGFAKDIEVENFLESGCAVCGQLTPLKELQDMTKCQLDLNLLIPNGPVTRKERHSSNDPIEDISGPVLLPGHNNICQSCLKELKMGKMPHDALANGLWVGDIPSQLKDLSWTEKLLISRVKHNICIVKVHVSGMSKMKANVVSHSLPMPKIYSALPPAKEELDEVLAFMYIGPNVPTYRDYKRTPMLVRRNKVAEALEWLKLNHSDYADLEISYDNLNAYSEDEPPVVVNYTQSMESNKDPEAAAVNDTEEDEGIETGECPFVVHGLTGTKLSQLADMRPYEITARAVEHFKSNGKALGIGQAKQPESMYDNPQLYPQMFPWLFPYGLGGLNNLCSHGRKPVSEERRKQQLLMYHDKRFQLEPLFPLVALNHEQMKKATTGGYILADRSKFKDVAQRIINLDLATLRDIIERLKTGPVKPETDAEKECFKVLNDLDHVNHRVQGSITSKKYMRQEIWSLVSYLGAPSWFITFAPADVKHPVALYMADTKEKFVPTFRDQDERLRLIANNPVAGARFFNMVVKLFLKHVLGDGLDRRGLYGETAGYYGTVEQQGRLTLHLHMLVWIRNSLTPQEIRDRIMDLESTFQKEMVEYLESVHKGEFATGDMDSVREEISSLKQKNPFRVPATERLPTVPPSKCPHSEDPECQNCIAYAQWWNGYIREVDEILYASNVHKCTTRARKGKVPKGTQNGMQEADNRGCTDPVTKVCKARFPREVFAETAVDPETGALIMKKGEAWLNTFTPAASYLLRCNHDVTSLLSGTAIKSVIAYVADYITKTPLKTHVMFQSIEKIFQRNAELLGGDRTAKDKARSLITKMVNALTAASEIGGPMASMYLLKHPDHYTSHQFRPCYWRGYVLEVMRAWSDSKDITPEGKSTVVVDCEDDQDQGTKKIVALSPVIDYMYRPPEYESVTVYDWIRRYHKRPIPKRKRKFQTKTVATPAVTTADDSDDFENNYIVDEGILSRQVPTMYLDPQQELDQYDADEADGIESDDEVTTDNGDSNIVPKCGGGGRCTTYEKEQSSEDELLLTAKSNAKLIHETKVQTQMRTRAPSYLNFHGKHPQAGTHEVCLVEEELSYVPNFIGGAIPRKDSGSREEYCMTMLTLFKPWRSGKDLRDCEDMQWSDVFDQYSFSDRQKEIMRFFHIRYECNDARDDFSAMRKQAERGGRYPMNMSEEDMNEIETQGYIFDGEAVGTDKENELVNGNDWNQDGDAEILRKSRVATVENIMNKAGWMDRMQLNDGYQMPKIPKRLKPEKPKDGLNWKTLLDKLRQDILEGRAAEAGQKKESSTGQLPVNDEVNKVKLVNKEYFLSKDFEIKDPQAKVLIENTIQKFSLNEEQERAFRIVANHAVESCGEHLKMYLGGMAGTGKSQVIKALSHFFAERHESYRFMCLAPTGSAAALIGGSTYHSMLGFRSKDSTESIAAMHQVRERLRFVQYIFLDEVSMVDCHSLYKICSKMCSALQNDGAPFGGINMIFAGDFAQLAPAMGGKPLYAHDVGRVIHRTHDHLKQKASIGKALWHQFTTVVILRQNMRQRSQKPEDAKLRTALENLRY